MHRYKNYVYLLLVLSGLLLASTQQIGTHSVAVAQNVEIDTSQPPVAVNSSSNLGTLTVQDGRIIIIRTGSASGLMYYSASSSATIDDVDVINGPGGVGRYLRLAGGSGAAALADVANKVADVTALLATSPTDNQLYQTLGYTTEGVGANLYRYDAASSATIDGGFVLPGPGGTLSFSGTTFNGDAGTGGRFIAVDQTVADVTKFGALGDGSTDDTNAFLRVVFVAGVGGKILVAKRTFKTTATIQLLEQQTFCGAGLGSVITSSITDGSAIISMEDNSSILDMSLDGVGSTSSSVGVSIVGSGGDAYARGSVVRVRVTECEVGFALHHCHIWSLENCYATSCGSGIHLGYGWASGETETCNSINIVGGEYTACTDGIKFTGQGSSVNIVGVTIEGNTTYGLHLLETDTSSWSNVTIDACYFETNGTAHIYMEDFARLWRIEGCRLSSGATACYAAIIGASSASGGRPYNTVFRNNQCVGTHANAKTIIVNTEANDTYIEWHKYHNLTDNTGFAVTNNGVNTILCNTEQFTSFASTDATPSVLGLKTAKTANASATTITALDGGYIGQEVTIVINDANTTIDFTGTTLKGNAGVDWTPATGDHMTCAYDGTNWYCTVSDNTP